MGMPCAMVYYAIQLCHPIHPGQVLTHASRAAPSQGGDLPELRGLLEGRKKERRISVFAGLRFNFEKSEASTNTAFTLLTEYEAKDTSKQAVHTLATKF